MSKLSDVSVIPIMTSNTSSVGSVISSSAYSTFYPWKAFDGLPGNAWLSLSNINFPHYIGYKFNEPIIIGGYSVFGADSGFAEYLAKDWQFQGSNDDFATFDILDTVTNQTGWTTDPRQFTINNPRSYTSYRLFITANNGGNQTGVGELQMFNLVYDKRFIVSNGDENYSFVDTGLVELNDDSVETILKSGVESENLINLEEAFNKIIVIGNDSEVLNEGKITNTFIKYNNINKLKLV